MSMIILAETVGAALLVTGSLIIAIAGIGLVRLGDPFMRMHAATKAGVVGAGLVMLGAGIATGTVSGALTGLAGLIFLVVTAPVASHVLGRAAYIAGAHIAPATVQDALAGVLPRNIRDIDPARTVRRARIANGEATEEKKTLAAPLRFNDASPLSANPHAVRRITAWLSGGERQEAALEVAFDLTQTSGAALTGLSAMDSEAGFRCEPVPAGGMYWASRLAKHRRQQMRSHSADALSSFERMASDMSIPASTRHEEGPIAESMTALSSCDLVIVPAGIDRFGGPAAGNDELAVQLASARIAPVLRVNRRPASVGRVALLMDNGAQAQHLAQGFLRSGLYPDVPVTIIPLGEQAERLAAEQADLLEAHGRKVSVMEPITLSDPAEIIRELFLQFDLVAMTTLSARAGWFSQLRDDPHEIAAESVPLTVIL